MCVWPLVCFPAGTGQYGLILAIVCAAQRDESTHHRCQILAKVRACVCACMCICVCACVRACVHELSFSH